MVLRVCIPTAGTGSRLGALTQYLNKSLVSIALKPTLSHLIEQFPVTTEFVIALGHKGNLVREFIELAYPHRTFFFSEVTPFEGPGSGLGLSLLSCASYLQQPFIFTSCDTLVKGTIPDPTTNWMGFAEREDITPYRTLFINQGKVKDICEKKIGSALTHKPYIGLAGIADYNIFWDSMVSGKDDAIVAGESFGLRSLIPRGITPIPFTWFDTGNAHQLEITEEAYQKAHAPNILEKANEAIWFINQQVIKFSDDETFIENRVKRSHVLKGFVPRIESATPHMYRYDLADGTVLSEVITVPLFSKLLTYAQNFWQISRLEDKEGKQFKDRCLSFYKTKTFERVALFFKTFNHTDGTEPINKHEMPSIHELLNKVDWEWLSSGLPGRFHGDFHFENILWSENTKSFTFLDWRQGFGGDLTHGDVYYDLAKLMHGLVICHELIAKKQFHVTWANNSISYSFDRKAILIECEQFLKSWLESQGYDVSKVRTLTALIFLNIAALHHLPYSLLLFALGKTMLLEEVNARPSK